MRFETLPDWLEWLEQQHPKSIDLGLERITVVADRLNVTIFDASVITVAGTNGKGSFVASLAALLRAHGQRVACYTSPHFLLFNERIDLNGSMVSDELLIDTFNMIDECRGDISLTYFEFTTLAALAIFKQQDFDQIILEVGLGGRLDAVNIIEPNQAVITSIGIDHEEYLGNDREIIAYEKCGILRKSTPLISAELDPPETLVQAIHSHQSLQIGRDFEIVKQADCWSFKSVELGIECEAIEKNGLSIPSQSAAICVAHQLLESRFSIDVINPVLSDLSLPGRFQRFMVNGITIILDVAHNVQAATMMGDRLSDLPLPTGGKRLAVFNILDDKDVGSIITELRNVFDAWFIGGIDHPRASDIHTLGELLTGHSDSEVNVSNNIQQAFEQARLQCGTGDQIIVFGSFYVVAELLPLLSEL